MPPSTSKQQRISSTPSSTSSQMQHPPSGHHPHPQHNPAHHPNNAQMLESLGGSLEGLSLSNSGGGHHAYWGAPATSSSSGSGFMPQPGAGHNNNSNSIQNHDAIETHDAISFQDTNNNNNPHHHNNTPLQPIVSSSNTNNTTNNNPIPITTRTSPTAPRKRGESIDIFLSTSPSQLDSGFLKFRNNDANTNTNTTNSNNGTEAIPPLSLDAQQQQQQQQQQPSSVNGLPPPPGMNNGTSTTNTTSNKQVVQQRDDCNRSPSCSVTGTSISSHSVSPSYSSQVVPEGGRRMVGNLAPVPVLPLGGTSQHHHQPHHIPQNSSSDGGGHRVGLPQQQQQQQQQQHLTQGSGTTATAPYGSSQGGREEFGRGGGFSSSGGSYSNRVGVVPSFAPATTFDAVSELAGDYNNPYSYAPTPAVGRDPHSLHPSFLPSHHSITSGSGGVGGQGPTSSLQSHHHQQQQQRHDDFGNIMSNNANINSNLLNLQQNNNSGHHQHHSHPSTSLGGSAVTVSGGGGQQQDPTPNSSSTNPQQQIFYMAVPTQDGQGQVLQPIQMVQLPGQPNAFVLPMGAQAQNIVAFNGTSGGINGTPVPSVLSSGSQGGGVGGANMMMATGASQQGIAGNSNNSGHNNDMDSHYVHPQSQTHGQKKNHRGGQRNNNANGGRHSGAGQYGQAHRGGKNGGGNVVGTHGTLPYGKQYYPQNGVAGGAGEVDSRMGLMGKQHHVDTTRQLPYNNHHNNNSNNNSIASKSYGENGYRDQHGDITLIGSDEFDVASLHDPSGGHHSTGGSRDISSSNSLNGKNDFVASLYASPQRPPLQDLLGHVRRLSRDQVGCRLLQQSLDEEEGTNAATLILTEGLSFWGEAMVDPFGNYLFQKILEKITAEERIILVKSVSARLVNASLNLHGTRSVQKVVELCAVDEANAIAEQSGGKNAPAETAAEILSRALAPAAARLCIDSHGNHVIQRILLKLPYRYSHFVFNAVATSVGDVARHRHGCCVIQRCLDSSPSAARSNLVLKIVEKSLELMQDAYGNYVVQYVLDVCSDEDVHAVCESVVGKVNLLAIQKFSSNVMEKCLDRCTDRVREVYLTELSDSERIRELMMDPFGNYVIQRALAVATHAQAVLLVDAMKPHLTSSTGNNGGIRNTAGGRRIITKICRRFPNFNVGDGVLTMGVGEQERGRGGGQNPTENTSRHDGHIVRRRGGGGGTGHSQANGGNPFF